MKKFIIAAIALALVVPATVSCKKDNKKDSDTSKPVTLTTPQFKDVAKTIDFKDAEEPITVNGKDVIPSKMIFSEGGRFILVGKPVTRASGDVFFTGTFTFGNNGYTVSFGFSVNITDSGSVSIVASDGEQTYSVTVTTSTSTSENQSNLCRSWSVSKILVKVPSKGLDKQYTSDFYLIAQDLKDKGIIKDAAPYEGYKVTEVTFTGAGDFVIYFDKKDPYVGTWTWKNASAGTFSYEFDTTLENQVLAGKADGNVSFSGNDCSVTLNAEVNGTVSEIVLSLTEKK